MRPICSPRPSTRSPEQPPPRKPKGPIHAPRLPPLTPERSSELRDRLLAEISNLTSSDELALWAHRTLPLKNTLTQEDSKAIEAAYLGRQGASSDQDHPAADTSGSHSDTSPPLESDDGGSNEAAMLLPKAVRKRSKAHLSFVATQPCLICKASPCDAHHLKIAQQRSLGRKVSDEYTVPLCRKHHQELHRNGNERAWWQNQGIEPLATAAALWARTNAAEPAKAQNRRQGEEHTSLDDRPPSRPFGSAVVPQSNETNPILRPEAG